MKGVCALPLVIPRKRTGVIIGIRQRGQLKRLGPFLILLFGFSLTSSLHAGMPFVPRDLPGAEKGRAETRWIAPYVLATSYSVGGKVVQTVRWFDENGIATRELSGTTVDARSDYIYERGLANEMIIHDVRGPWKIVLPKKSGPAFAEMNLSDIQKKRNGWH